MIKCSVETIDNGVVIGTSTTFGHMIKYKCNDNYILHNGDEFQTCVESGAWNGTKPRCAGIFIYIKLFSTLIIQANQSSK